MTIKNVSSCAFGATTIYGVTSIDIEADNNCAAKHVDDDQFASKIIDGQKTRAITVNGVDLSIIQGLVSGAEATLAIVLEGVDGDANVDVTLLNAKPHDVSIESGEVNDDGTASVVFTGKSSTTDPLTIAAVTPPAE